MKDLIKNDEAVSVVVGSILILAVLMTFISVVASSWVPIYERNAESGHGDELFNNFLDLRKQMENADEFPKITSISLGTDEMPLMKNTNSVGRLELNESAGTMALTSTIYYSASGSDVGDSLSINNLNTDEDSPIQDFSFNFTFDDKDHLGELPNDFEVKLKSLTMDRLEIKIEEDGTNKIEIEVKYKISPEHKWKGENIAISSFTGLNLTSDSNNTYFYIDMLSSDIYLTLEKPESSTIYINGDPYKEGTTNNTCSLGTLIQYYLKQPADGTYDFYYDKVKEVSEGTQILLYNTTEGTVGGTEPQLDLLNIGGGVITMESDYNFMVDQSYIYDTGAVILKQEDGAIFKVEPPIFVDNDDVSNDLIISFQTIVLTGDRAISGNGLETIQTVLAKSEYMASGLTDEITITKDTTSELYDLWHSYFSELGDFVNLTSANSTDLSNETMNQVGIKINSTAQNILLTVQTKEIAIT